MKRSAKIVILIAVLAVLLCTCIGCTRLNSIFGISSDKTSLDVCNVTCEYDVYQYTGEEIKPVVTVKYANSVLEPDVDYTVAYKNNIEVGTGTVTVTGIGNYTGTASAEFEIVPEVYTYTFACTTPSHCVFSGKTVQNVTDKSQLQAPTASADGYTFVGWYTLPSNPVDFNDPDTVPDKGAQIYALFTANNYTITYANIDDSENSQLNPTVYTYEDYIELNPAADRAGEYFAGWYLDKELTQRINYIEQGTSGNIVLYAKYISSASNYKLTYVVPDGVDVPSFEYYPYGSILTSPQVVSDDSLQEIVWYADSSYQYKYVFKTMPKNNVTVYGRWEDVLDAGFFDRVDDGSIDSYEKLAQYIEYICFYNVTSINAVSVKFSYVSGEDNIKSEISKAAAECTFPRMCDLYYKTQSNSAKIYLTEDLTDEIATVTGTALADRYDQYEDVLYQSTSSRSADFDDFAINYVDETYECSTSDQLFYVLSHGYRPVPAAGSKAQSVYESYKAIMRSIVDDTMSDYEKVKAIYEWLVLNVYYDNYVAENTGEDYYVYKAFYLEGVLEGSAVCDGISKAFSVMCAIEGIDCVRVTGKINGANVGHAWNKVQILDGWYLTDATWGNQTFNISGTSSEFLVYDYLLFTDEDRESDGYVSNNYIRYETVSQLSAYDVYNDIEITVSGVTADLLIDDSTELSYVFEYIYYVCDDESGKTLNIMISKNANLGNMVVEAYQKLRQRRGFGSYSQDPLIFAYGNVVTDGSNYVGGTKFIFIFQ